MSEILRQQIPGLINLAHDALTAFLLKNEDYKAKTARFLAALVIASRYAEMSVDGIEDDLKNLSYEKFKGWLDLIVKISEYAEKK